jgi:Rho GTPase-activating protein 39
LNKNVQKEALKNFKNIQKIMGDRSGSKSKSNSEDIQNLLQSGINHGDIRDEIYCQVIKQLTNNPKVESMLKGWELMACLVVTFPPSKNFESYLENFIQGNQSASNEKIQTLAKHCSVKLERISKKGPRGKVPTIAEIDRAKEAAFFPSVFGEALNDIMDSQKSKYPDLKLPRIMTFLSDAILKLNGCATEGIFRVPGDADAGTLLYTFQLIVVSIICRLL